MQDPLCAFGCLKGGVQLVKGHHYDGRFIPPVPPPPPPPAGPAPAPFPLPGASVR